MNRIQKISHHMIWICRLLLIMIPITIILTWVFIETGFIKTIIQAGMTFSPTMTPEGVVTFDSIKWSFLTKTLGFCYQVVGFLPNFITLLFLLKIFKNYKKGNVFTLINAKHYQKLGWVFFIDALVIKPLENTLLILTLTISNEPGHRYLNIAFGAPSLTSLFYSAVFIAISWVMMEASKIHDEQSLTV